MYGLAANEWQDLVLSVNTHQAHRRLSPVEVARHLKKALERGSVAQVAESLGFRDESTVRRFLLLNLLEPELQAAVDWGAKAGKIGFSAAVELLGIGKKRPIRTAFEAALKHSFTRDEARQVKQAFRRGTGPIEACVEAALKTRPKVECRELILGTLLNHGVEDGVARLEPASREELISRVLRCIFPTVKFLGYGLNAGHFSLVLDEKESRALRVVVGERSLEDVITHAIAQCLGKAKS